MEGLQRGSGHNEPEAQQRLHRSRVSPQLDSGLQLLNRLLLSGPGWPKAKGGQRVCFGLIWTQRPLLRSVLPLPRQELTAFCRLFCRQALKQSAYTQLHPAVVSNKLSTVWSVQVETVGGWPSLCCSSPSWLHLLCYGSRREVNPDWLHIIHYCNRKVSRTSPFAIWNWTTHLSCFTTTGKNSFFQKCRFLINLWIGIRLHTLTVWCERRLSSQGCRKEGSCLFQWCAFTQKQKVSSRGVWAKTIMRH